MGTRNGTKALIPYLRRSRADEEKISIEDQRTEIRDWAERTGTRLAPEVVEMGVSGHTSWKERELGDVVARCERGEVAGIVVAYFSRLTREEDEQTWSVLSALRPHRLVCVRNSIDKAAGRRVDLATAITAYQSTEEWETLRANLTKGKHSSWERGTYVGSAPAGFDRVDGTLVQNEYAAAVRDAIRLRAGGGSWTEVARLLTAHEVPTSKGRTTWTRASAKAALRNSVYKGLHRCTCGCGETALRPEWRLVSPSAWRAAQPEPGVQAVGRADRGQALLGGLLRCGGCGGTLSPDSTTVGGKTYRHYRCKGRGPACPAAASVAMDAVEEHVVALALAHLNASEPRVGDEDDPAERARLEGAVETAEADLASFLQHARPSDPGYAEALDGWRERADAANHALGEYQDAVGVEFLRPERIAEIWERMPVDVRRRVLREILESAVVARPATPRARVPVEERVTVTMRELAWPRITAADVTFGEVVGDELRVAA